MSNGWIAVDLDGTLAEYNGWISESHIGNPVALMVGRVKQWVAEGKDVRIFTARISPDFDENDPMHIMLRASPIQNWCKQHIGVVLPITCRKDFGMIELWDDRCVQVEPNTGRRMDGQ